MNIIEYVAQAVNLKESPNIIEQYLLMLYFKETKNPKVIAKKLLIPVPVATAIKKELIKIDLVIQGYGITLSVLGIKFVEEMLGYDGVNKQLYYELLHDLEKCAEYQNQLAVKIKDIFDNRPAVDVTLDQAHATVETAIKRAVLALQNHTLIGKRILFVGDDDLISIATAFLLQDLFPKTDKQVAKLMIFDISTALFSYISCVSETHNFKIECHQLDLRNPIPEELLQQFDTVFTDPPYTLVGLKLFLSRAISCLKKGLGHTIFLSFGNKAVNDTAEIQRMITSHNLIIKNIVATFNTYIGASLLANQSQMMVLVTTMLTFVPIDNNWTYEGPLYTNEFNRPREGGQH